MSGRSPIAPPAGATLIQDEPSRERQELVRTQRALNEEVRSLMRRRSSLVDEIDMLRGEAALLVQGANNFERFIKSNRRFFERLLEREIARTSRDVNGRFSTAMLSVSEGPMPRWFAGFLTQITRASDLCVRVGATEFWLFLHGAGGLGRRIFQSRLAQSLSIAGKHHRAPIVVEMGASSYPIDGESPQELLSIASDRVHRVDRRLLPAPTPKELGINFALMPPRGVPLDAPRRAKSRVRQSLEDAANEASSGEVVVRSEEVVGRVYMCRGQIAWAHCTSHALSLTEFLVTSCGADPEEVRFAYEYCKKSGGNFAETLIEFGTFDRQSMRKVLQRHLRAHLGAVIKLPNPDVLFLPQNRRYHSDLLFPLDALIPPDPYGDGETTAESIVRALRR